MTDDWMAEVKGRVPHRPKRRWWAVAARPMPISVLDLPMTTPGAVSVAAYGLRKLRSNYNGPAINVVRTSDSAAIDVGFRGVGDLDVQTLSSFIGGSVGHINTWYDQTTAGANLTNSGSTTPIINLTGANGLPTVAFLTTDILHHPTTPASAQPFTFNAVAGRTGAFTSYGGIIGDDSGTWSGLYFDSSANGPLDLFAGGLSGSGVACTDSVLHSLFGVLNGSSTLAAVDGTISAPFSAGANSYTGSRIASIGPYPLTANVSEGIFWNVALNAADITSLTANQRAYWHTP